MKLIVQCPKCKRVLKPTRGLLKPKCPKCDPSATEPEEMKMTYTTHNYKTKKALIEDVKAGKTVTVFQPNGDLTGVSAPDNGTVYLEGPHYPQPHKWYAAGEMKDGKLVRVK